MNPEEALKQFKEWNESGWSKSETPSSEALILAIQALGKQVPKKPKKLSYEPLIKHGWKYECPECTKAIGLNSVGFDYTDEDPFCPSCGQRIGWEETL